MFDTLLGTIQRVDEKNICLTNGAIGFDIHVPNEHPFAVNTEAKVFIHFHWNTEQGPTLYGFQTQAERDIFRHIISCSGIGPRLGLTILSQLSPGQLINAVSTHDQKALSSISGIGSKKAEQIILHLKSKVSKIIESGIDTDDAGSAKNIKELSDVLSSLHYTRSEINDTLQHIKTNKSLDLPFDTLLRDALSFLTKLR